MLVEGTRSLNRSSGELGVSDRSAPLPSPETDSQVVKEREGKALNDLQVEDRVTLSVAADSVSNSDQEGVRTPTEESANPEDASTEDARRNTETTAQAQDEEKERIAQLTEQVNEKLNESLSLRFRQDEETGVDIFQLVEPETGNVVRQIPAEEVLEFMRKFEESVSGLFVSQQA